ncbi:MAG TPA: aminoglycoside 6'-N-acetyltransferase [Pyrinomonadaceae bacterium]|jgi:aminoglycoside 6'-N-acetyltransferase I
MTTDTKFRVRVLEERDLQEWLRLRKLLWDGVSEAEHREEMLDIFDHTETQLVLVSETEKGNLVGFLEASIRPFVEDCVTDHVGYLEGWFVEPEYRQHGVGRELVRNAEKWARGKGCVEMASDSEIGNDLSVKAHSKLGYTETSRLIHWRKEL